MKNNNYPITKINKNIVNNKIKNNRFYTLKNKNLESNNDKNKQIIQNKSESKMRLKKKK